MEVDKIVKQTKWQWFKTFFRLWFWSWVIVFIRGRLICPFCGQDFPNFGYSHFRCENIDCVAHGFKIYEDGSYEVIE